MRASWMPVRHRSSASGWLRRCALANIPQPAYFIFVAPVRALPILHGIF